MQVEDVRLANWLAPLGRDEFIEGIYGRKHAYFSGPPERFGGLFDWITLNRLLACVPLEYPRLRIMLEGSPVPRSDYELRVNSRLGGDRPRLDAGAVYSALRRGGTLAIADVQELHGPIAAAAGLLESDLRESVSVNAYVSFGERAGFELHRDPHDVFVLQIAGRKLWRVDVAETDRPPSERDPQRDNLVEQIVTPGDMLYLPRGWWHSATPMNEPTIHLAFGVSRPSRVEFLTWVARMLDNGRSLSAEIPALACRTQKEAFLADLREGLNRALNVDTLSEFLGERDVMARLPSALSLPGAVDSGDSLQPRDVVTFVAPRAVLTLKDDVCELQTGGQQWTFVREAHPVLVSLLPGVPISVEDLVAGASIPDASQLLRELWHEGLVVVESSRMT